MNFGEFLTPVLTQKYKSGQSLKVYSLLNRNEKEKNQYIPKKSQLLKFMILRIFTKNTFRHRLTQDPDCPVQFKANEDLLYFENENTFTEEIAIQRLKIWENNRLPADIINDQLTGFQILKCCGKLSTGYKKSFFLFWTSATPHSKIFLRIPGYAIIEDQTLYFHKYKKYVRDDRDMCFRPEEFTYNSAKYIIKPKLFV